MKVVYLSGKYRDARGIWYVNKNIEKARDAAVKLWQMGFAVITPHCNTMHFEGPIDDSIIMAGDVEFVKRADALVLMDNWSTSEGTKIEWQAAFDARKPIFYWPFDKRLLGKWHAGTYDIVGHMQIQQTTPTIQRWASNYTERMQQEDY